MEKRGLGRGLSALMADVATSGTPTAPATAERRIAIDAIVPNPDQPRRTFRATDLDELTASIREKGVLQPLIVRPAPETPGHFQIVAGERRWRAAQMAQLHEVPVVVREYSDSEMLEIAIIENVQRADLNPVEEALGYRQLMDKFGHTQERLGEALGKSRSHIANVLRLLQLPDDVLQRVQTGELTAGHARALITSPQASQLAEQVIAKALSVRDTEKLAKASAAPAVSPRAAQPWTQKDADTRALEADLTTGLGMRVTVDHKPGAKGGKITISYGSLDDLDTLCRLLSLNSADASI